MTDSEKSLDILIVDDLTIGDMLAASLRKQGHDVDTAGTFDAVDPDRNYDVLVVEPFHSGYNSGGSPHDDGYVDLIKTFPGRVYIATTQVASKLFKKVLGQKISGADYDRLYHKPFSTLDFFRDLAIDATLPPGVVTYKPFKAGLYFGCSAEDREKYPVAFLGAYIDGEVEDADFNWEVVDELLSEMGLASVDDVTDKPDIWVHMAVSGRGVISRSTMYGVSLTPRSRIYRAELDLSELY